MATWSSAGVPRPRIDRIDGTMTGDTMLDLEARRRRIRFRAWHRGTREMDLVMGRFCDAELAGLPEADLADLEALLEAQDRDVFSWVTGEIVVPMAHDTAVFRRICAFHTCARPRDR